LVAADHVIAPVRMTDHNAAKVLNEVACGDGRMAGYGNALL
jgi:hypothetical protein